MSLEVSEFPLQLEYKKHSNIAPADIARLRDWLHTQPHMPDKYITDLDLILAYHSCNCSMEVTKQVLDLHYTFKTHSTMFKDREIRQSTIDNMNTVLILPLKDRAHDGSAGLYFSLMHDNAKTFSLFETIRTIEMVISLWQWEEGSWPGCHAVLDLRHLSLAFISKLDLDSLRQIFFFVQEVLLVRVKHIHFVNAPNLDKLMIVIKRFIKKELLDLLIIHPPGHRSIEQYYPMAGLPADAGGEGMTFEEAAPYMIQKLQANERFFELDMKKRVQESARRGKAQTLTDFYAGVDGSFKNLDID